MSFSVLLLNIARTPTTRCTMVYILQYSHFMLLSPQLLCVSRPRGPHKAALFLPIHPGAKLSVLIGFQRNLLIGNISSVGSTGRRPVTEI